MIHIIRIFLAAPLLVAVAACSGSNSNDSMSFLDDADTIAKLKTAKGYSAVGKLPGAEDTINSVLAAASLPTPDAAALAGTATYSGSMVTAGRDELGSYASRGDLAMSANFDSGKLTGTVGNITNYDDLDGKVKELGGSLALDGKITASSLTATVTGAILDPDEDDAWNVTGKLDGEFRGKDAEVVAGVGSLKIGGVAEEAAFSAEKN